MAKMDYEKAMEKALEEFYKLILMGDTATQTEQTRLTTQALVDAMKMLDISKEQFAEGIMAALASIGATAQFFVVKDYPSKMIVMVSVGERYGTTIIDASHRFEDELIKFQGMILKWKETGLPFIHQPKKED
jgi:hypothetical protein